MVAVTAAVAAGIIAGAVPIAMRGDAPSYTLLSARGDIVSGHTQGDRPVPLHRQGGAMAVRDLACD